MFCYSKIIVNINVFNLGVNCSKKGACTLYKSKFLLIRISVLSCESVQIEKNNHPTNNTAGQI